MIIPFARITVNLDIGKLTGRDETMKIPNIPPFYSVSLAQVAPRAPRAFIGPPLAATRVKTRTDSILKSEAKKSSHYSKSEQDSQANGDGASTAAANETPMMSAITPQEYAATKQMFKPRIKIKKAVAAAAEQKFFMLDDD